MSNYELMRRHHYRSWLGIIPGWEWLEVHEHDLDGWQPTFEFSRPGSRISLTVKNAKVISEVCKVISEQ